MIVLDLSNRVTDSKGGNCECNPAKVESFKVPFISTEGLIICSTLLPLPMRQSDVGRKSGLV